ncbi:alpha/beta hydrolase [Kribbella turkmenica]|uniref:Alpha/beta hydrolase n=1 Tax=Kribbella turkmenica TaxID=2530375 RepID=A0A4R4XIK8_9ACTN|nr:alpha/beta hydrolase [Kribbella turkmenica]TDD30342.1 alpha/beta hydrolase [Kribbella turkmenica]
MVRVALILVSVVVLLLAVLWGYQRQLIYLPDTTAVTTSVGRDVELETSDGLRLGAWLVPGQQPARDVAVLVANGNGGNRAGRAPLARALSAQGLTVLLFDYRGYGGNEGSPSERGLARDVRAAQQYLVDSGVPADRIVYFGESLGAAVVTELATSEAPAGLVLRSPFVDLASVGQVHYPFLPVRLLLRDKFPLAEHLAAVKAPVSVVYGSDDSVVPSDQSRKVAEAAPTLKDVVEIPGADHNDAALVHGPEVVAAVVRLVEQL